MQDIGGRTAVITGAASGIGRGTALALAREGANLLLADIDVAGGEETAALAEAAGAKARFEPCDVSQAGAFIGLAEAARTRFGGCDILMNNVGVLTRGRPEDIPATEWERVLDTNLLSVARSLDAFLPGFLARGDGHIVNVASFAALWPYAYDRLPYAASKAGVVAITEGLALYLRPKGIGVTLFCPGPVITNIGSSVRTWGPPIGVRGPGAGFAPISAAEAGERVVQAIREDRFLLLSDPQARDFMVRRAQDWDQFIAEQTADVLADKNYG